MTRALERRNKYDSGFVAMCMETVHRSMAWYFNQERMRKSLRLFLLSVALAQLLACIGVSYARAQSQETTNAQLRYEVDENRRRLDRYDLERVPERLKVLESKVDSIDFYMRGMLMSVLLQLIVSIFALRGTKGGK